MPALLLLLGSAQVAVLHTVIKNLRRALRDSAEDPRFIQTFPRRGYRLMVPVEWSSADDSSASPSGGAGGTAVRLRHLPGLIAVGGIEGRSVMLRSASPFPDANGQPQVERDWLVAVPHRDGVIFMIFVAPQSEFARFQPTYEAMLKSAQFQ